MKPWSASVAFASLLALCTGLFGCSTGNTLSPAAEGRWFNNAATLNLPNSDPAHPWQLTSARTIFNGQKLFLTLHERKLDDYHSDSTCAIYLKNGERFKLLKRLSTGDPASTSGPSYFAEPKFIQFGPDRIPLIDITECFYGTGSLTCEHFFHPVALGSLPNEEIGLQEVAFIPAYEAYHFGPDEGMHWEADYFTDEKLSFKLMVDHCSETNYETVGKVTGTFKLEQSPDGHWQISPANFTRVPAVYSDYH